MELDSPLKFLNLQTQSATISDSTGFQISAIVKSKIDSYWRSCANLSLLVTIPKGDKITMTTSILQDNKT